MIHAQMQKNVILANPAGTSGSNVTSGATTGFFVDCQNASVGGAAYAEFTIVMQPALATNSSAAWTKIQLKESDDSNVSNSTAFGTFDGTTGTPTSTQFAQSVNNDTAVGQLTKFYVDLRGRKRFLHLILQPSQTANYNRVYADVEFTRIAQAPSSTTERGANVGNAVIG